MQRVRLRRYSDLLSLPRVVARQPFALNRPVFHLRDRRSHRVILAFILLLAVGISNASALPSFSRQTGETCDSCHVGAFGPQLTPHGVRFKLGGYIDSDNKPGHLPLAAMLVANLTHTADPQDVTLLPSHASSNNNLAVQEVSGFVGGQIYKHLGAFAQGTYSGIERSSALDNVDVRLANEINIGGRPALVGISVNNNPTVQDPFNTTPVWRFPYVSSDFAPGPEHAPLIDDGLAGQVMGITGYTLLGNGIYAEAGAYRSLSEGVLNKLHVGAETRVSGVAPYGRVAFTRDRGGRSYSIGAFGMTARTLAFGDTGPGDRSTDLGLDGHYQFLGSRRHVLSVDSSFIHESQSLSTTTPGIEASLRQFNLSTSYHFAKTYGLTLRHFNISGSDATAASNGWTMQGDWTPFGKESSFAAPWANLRLGLQYTSFHTLNGETAGVHGSNSVMGFLWLSL